MALLDHEDVHRGVGSARTVTAHPAIYAEINDFVATIRARLTVYHVKKMAADMDFAFFAEREFLSLCAMRLMIWMLGHRAVASGEITSHQRRERFTIGGDWPRSVAGFAAPAEDPHEFSDLIGEGLSLLRRCQRIDGLAAMPDVAVANCATVG